MAYPRTHNLFGSHFCGVEMRQYWSDLALWELFLNAHNVNAIVELGAFHGGMTLFLKAQAVARHQRFYTLDRDYPVALSTALSRALELPADFLEGNFWTETNAPLLDILHDETLKPLLLFVDGGNKAQEFEALVPELAVGDYAAVHDYGTEFRPGQEDVVEELIERVFWEECMGPPQPCLTRFWRRV